MLLRRESLPTVTLFLVVLIFIWGTDYAALLVVVWGVDEAALLIFSASPAESFLQISERFCKGTSVFWKEHLWLWGKTVLTAGPCCSKFPFFHTSLSPFCVFSWSSSLLCVSLGSLLLLGFGLWVYSNCAWNQQTLSFLGKNFSAFLILYSPLTASCLS